MLNKSCGHTCLVAVIRGKVFSCLPLTMILAVGSLWKSYYQIKDVSPSIPSVKRVFITNVMLNSVKGFFASIDIFM